MDTRNIDVAVVGGGLGGLTAAAFAARAGAKVALFERASTTGGRAETTDRSGFRMNRGAHALYLRGPAERSLRELGVVFTGGQPDPRRYRVVRRRQFHRFVYDVRSLLTTRLLSAPDRFEGARLMMRLQKAGIDRMADVPLKQWLDSEVRSPVFRAYLESVVRLATFTNDPARISAGAALAVFQGASVMYVDGGWQTLADGVRAAAADAGASIFILSRATSVEPVPGGGAIVHFAGGDAIGAKAVILAVAPEDAAAFVRGTAWDGAASAWLASEPVRVAVLDLGLERLPVPSRPIVISQERPIYLSAHSSVAKLAPEGQALVSLVRYLAPGESSDGALAEMEAFADLVQPGWREAEVERQFLPSMVVSNRELLASQGGIAGRPPVRVPGPEGLFVAGDWVGPTGMLSDAVFASAREAGIGAAAIATRGSLAVAS